MDHTNNEIVRYLHYQQKHLNIAPEKFRVLDFGCGIGLSVLSLRQAGYDAFGVDIDPGEVKIGQKLLSDHGYSGEDLIRLNNPDGTIPFENHHFHFVFSQEVIEHVSNLSLMARELKRLLIPGCISFHVHRPQFNIVEPHIHMPFVHWIPKSIWRKYAITFFVKLGVCKKPPEVPPPGKDVLIERYYRESMDDTFYRPYRSIGGVFVDNGFYIAFPVTNHRRIRGSRLFETLLHIPLFEPFLVWLIMTFRNAYLLSLRPAHRKSANEEFVMDGWRTKWIGHEARPRIIHHKTRSRQPAG
jgi:SAM-dependent methyltransferase